MCERPSSARTSNSSRLATVGILLQSEPQHDQRSSSLPCSGRTQPLCHHRGSRSLGQPRRGMSSLERCTRLTENTEPRRRVTIAGSGPGRVDRCAYGTSLGVSFDPGHGRTQCWRIGSSRASSPLRERPEAPRSVEIGTLEERHWDRGRRRFWIRSVQSGYVLRSAQSGYVLPKQEQFLAFLTQLTVRNCAREIDDLLKSKGLHSVSAYGHGAVCQCLRV